MAVLRVALVCFVLALSRSEDDFIAGKKAVAVRIGQDLTLDCDVEPFGSITTSSPSSPPPSPSSPADTPYHWLFNGTEISSSLAKALIFHNHSLFVPRVQRDDLGWYECIQWSADQPEISATTGRIHVIEAYIDDFYLSPQSQVLYEGNTTILQCVSGYSAPAATVYWQKDGRLFLQGTQQTARFGTVLEGVGIQQSLTLQFTAQVQYNGTYRCVAYNPLANRTKTSEEAAIKIQAPLRSPYITKPPPAQLLLTEGLSHLLTCPISGWPLVRVFWYRAGMLVSVTDRIRQLENGSLYFDPVLRQDAGTYHCIGTNTLGSVPSAPTDVSVAYLDVTFKQDPVDTDAMAGQSTSLYCQPPDGYPNVTVLWYKGAAPVQPRIGLYAVSMDANQSLVFENVQMEDAGLYYCVAYNSLALPESRTSEGARLSVEGSPQLYEPPLDTTIVRGDLLTLTCKVKGYPQPTVAWFKDNELLLPNTRIIMSELGQVLLISDVTILDEGYYRCLASNVHGRKTSQLVFVDVIVPPEITVRMNNVRVEKGDNALFTCGYYGDPVPNTTWYKDGKRLTLRVGSRLFQTREGLHVINTTRQDEGRYTCRADNVAGHGEQNALLDVQERPTFISYPDDTTVNISQSVIFYCQATGDPEPVASWRINGSNKIPPGIVISDDVSTLIINSVTSALAGNYTCFAENSLSRISHTAVLIVQEKPMIREILGNRTINQGSILDLHCLAEGQPAPQIQWLYNNRDLESSYNSRLVLTEGGARLRLQYVSSGDSGYYSCRAYNGAGADKKTVQIYVRETPLPPFLDKAEAVSRSSVNLTWIPVRQEFYTQLLYYVVQYKPLKAPNFLTFRDDVSNRSTSVEVDNLGPGQSYVFRVAARNSVGVGDYSRVIGASTVDSAPGAVRNLKLESATSTELTLRWEIPRQTNGEIYRYEIQYKPQTYEQGYTSDMVTVPSFPVQSYRLFDLRPYTTYTVRVRAATRDDKRLLWGDFTNITVSTRMEVPTSPPPNVLITVLSSTEIKITWQPVPSQFQNGALLGYVVYYKLADTQQPMVEQRTKAVATETIITNLLPWRYYVISVAAFNAAGVGTKTGSRRVRTLAETPSGPPRDVRVTVVGPRSIQVSWKELAEDDRRSEISGYLVWYTNTTTNESYSTYIADPTVHSAVLSNLVPWTVYSVRVQAFTTQVVQGFGPLSLEKRVQTEQDVPGHVSDMKVTVGSTEVTVTWRPPDQPNGVITGYEIVIYKLDTDKEATAIRQKRSIIHYDPEESSTIQTYDLSALDTNVVIDRLYPDNSYTVTLAAKTRLGTGPYSNVTFKTNPTSNTELTSEAVDTTTEAPSFTTKTEQSTEFMELVAMTTSVGLTRLTQTTHDSVFIGTVAGSVIGSCLVLLLLVFVIIVCCKRIGPAKSSYLYSDSQQTGTDSSETESDDYRYHQRHRHLPSHVNGATGRAAPYTTSNTDYPQSSSVSSPLQRPLVNNQRNAGRSNHPRPQPVVTTNTRPAVNRSDVFTISQPPLYAPFSTESEPSPSGGYDNLGFVREDFSGHRRTVPVDPYNTRELSFKIKPDVRTRHSLRMTNRTAAVIAAQRKRDWTPYQNIPDTNQLLDESVIVYNERTAL